MSKLIHARFTENGDSGWNGKAQAGDQTGNEVSVTNFYSAPWDFCLRYFNWELAREFAIIAKKLAGCVKVGYDQSQRNDHRGTNMLAAVTLLIGFVFLWLFMLVFH